MSGVIKDRVIVGNGEEYKYVPVSDFIVEETEEVFFTKHPYRVLTEKDSGYINLRRHGGRDVTGVNGARNFVENNDMTRAIKVNEGDIPLLDYAKAESGQLAKDLVEFAKNSKNTKGHVQLYVHFSNLQTYTYDSIRSSYFYSGGEELELLPNYGGSICWGSHRVSQNVAKETAHNEYLNMLFNYDISNGRRESFGEDELNKLSEVVKFFGYSDDEVRWLENRTKNRYERFTVFDMFLLASFFGVCVDDYLKRKE